MDTDNKKGLNKTLVIIIGVIDTFKYVEISFTISGFELPLSKTILSLI